MSILLACIIGSSQVRREQQMTSKLDSGQPREQLLLRLFTRAVPIPDRSFTIRECQFMSFFSPNINKLVTWSRPLAMSPCVYLSLWPAEALKEFQ